MALILRSCKGRFPRARSGYTGTGQYGVPKNKEMPEGFVHTVQLNGRWVNALEGRDRVVLGYFDTREEAVDSGREEARRRMTEHLIHNEDLSIGERHAYRDPAISSEGE